MVLSRSPRGVVLRCAQHFAPGYHISRLWREDALKVVLENLLILSWLLDAIGSSLFQAMHPRNNAKRKTPKQTKRMRYAKEACTEKALG